MYKMAPHFRQASAGVLQPFLSEKHRLLREQAFENVEYLLVVYKIVQHLSLSNGSPPIKRIFFIPR